LWFKRAIIIPAARWDSFSDFGGRTSPKVGLVLSMGDEWQASIKGNYGWSFRAPSFNDLYWPQDPWTRGNPNLRPESGKDFDIGAMLRHPFWWGLSVDAAYFQNNVTDLISWQPGSSGLWMPGNVGMAKIQGMEAKIAVTPWNSVLRIEWNYTNVLAVNETDVPNEQGKILPYRPRHTHNVSIEADYAGVSMRATTTYVTKRYTSIANTMALPSYMTADASIGWRYSVSGVPMHIQCEGKNLFDLEYQIMDGFPMPPREFRLTLGIDASGIVTLSGEDSESSNPRSQ
jgi:vitamin B12 transporter